MVKRIVLIITIVALSFLSRVSVHSQETTIKISDLQPFINAGLSAEAMKGILLAIELGIPVKLQGLSLEEIAKVGKGSYLANGASGCFACHTWPTWATGGDPFRGQPKKINITNYMAGGRPFTTPAGTFISLNLTPDPTTELPRNVTEEQFINILRTGIGTAGKTLQVMPWPEHREMTDADLKAIYSFLKAIPHAEPAPPPPPAPPAQ